MLSNYLKEASLPDSLEIDEAFKKLMHKNKSISSLRVRNIHSYDVRDSETFKKSFKAVESILSQRSLKPATLNKKIKMALKGKIG